MSFGISHDVGLVTNVHTELVGFTTAVHVEETGFATSVHPLTTELPVVVYVSAMSSPIGSPPPDSVTTDDSVGFGTCVHAAIHILIIPPREC